MTWQGKEVSGWVVKGCLITHPPCPHRKLFVFVAVVLSNLILFNKSWAKSINTAFCRIKTLQMHKGFGVLLWKKSRVTEKETQEKKLFLCYSFCSYCDVKGYDVIFYKTDRFKSHRHHLSMMHPLNGVECWWIMYRLGIICKADNTSRFFYEWSVYVIVYKVKER